MKKFNSRELSWLLFNERVLQEAQDESVPLMQRLRFLGIFSNNQDEFFKVRVANLIRLSQIKGQNTLQLTGGYTPKELLAKVYKRIDRTREAFDNCYDDIISKMRDHSIYVVDQTQITDAQRAFCQDYFLSIISVRLVPLMVRKSGHIPFLPDGNIYLAIKMSKKGKVAVRYSIIQIPVSKACPRFVVLPSETSRTDVIFLDDIIRMFLDDIFFMFSYDTITAHSFKFMRDGELTLDDDVSKGLVQKMEQGISDRERGKAIWFTYDRDMPEDVVHFITGKLNLRTPEQLKGGSRYHLMRDLMKFPKVCPELENSNPKALTHSAFDPSGGILKVIKKRDILLYYPYHTFKHFIDLLRESAVDPRVESIFITLYRTADRSKVINALKNAAKNGKHVTVLVELKARFDEEHNIDITNDLQQAGARVLHSLEGLKVHSKLLLIERREGKAENVGYVYVGTGNFNENTAQIYSDFGLFTSDQTMAQDARKVFDSLVNNHHRYQYTHFLVSPYDMRNQIEKLIDAEIKSAKKGKEAFFYGKFNSLTDEKLIEHLYKASQMGVKVRLVIRGACCLKPQVAGLSENIEVRSIVDKYLEHARMIICYNGGDHKSYILSADPMTRNLDRRVEVGVPILDPKIHKALFDIFEIQWSDNVKSRNLRNFESNEYVDQGDNIALRSQLATYDYLKEK